MTKRNRVILILVAGCAAIAIAAQMQTSPARKFQAQFDSAVVGVELNGTRMNVAAYEIQTRAEFRMCMMDEWEAQGAEEPVIFVLQSGLRVECTYIRKGNEIWFKNIRRTFFPIGVGKDLWPQSENNQPANSQY